MHNPGESDALVRRPVALSDSWRVAASCAGFLADAYDLFTIDLVVLLLQFEYGADVVGKKQKTMMVSMMLCGVVVGQLTFGFVADMIGRRWAFITTAALTIVGALASACVQESVGWFDLAMQLALTRFWLGIGVGGEYPLSATVTAEAFSDDVQRRGFLMACVISMQGFGMLLSCIVAFCSLTAGLSFQTTWRLLLAFGAIPSCVAFYLRTQMHESEVFTKARESQAASKTAVQGSLSLIGEHWWHLVGTSATWFCMNLFQYSLGSFKSTILADVMSGGDLTPDQTVRINVKFATVTSLFAISGFAVGLYMVTRLRRFTMQINGFVCVAATFFNIAYLSAGPTQPAASTLVIYFGLMFFFINSGPNITTFILPAEIFPTRVRATCHGISAASGKMGAVLGTIFFESLVEALGMPMIYFGCGVIAMSGAVITFIFTPMDVVKLSELEVDGTTLDGKQKYAATGML